MKTTRHYTPPPSAMAVSTLRALDDGGLPPRFDGNIPPRRRGRNLFLPCPHCGKQNHPTNKCWKQFGKPPIAQGIWTPPAPFSPTPPKIPAPQYHVTLTSAEYDALLHFVSIDASSFSSLALLPAHRYYIVFVDDYTRVSWVYLLCDRFEVVTTVTHFIMEVVTQYSTTPKILCTDNALEFVQTSLRTFCADRGIIH